MYYKRDNAGRMPNGNYFDMKFGLRLVDSCRKEYSLGLLLSQEYLEFNLSVQEIAFKLIDFETQQVVMVY